MTQRLSLAALFLCALAAAEEPSRCGVKNRHLTLHGQTAGGTVSVELRDFETLRANEKIEWNLEPGSASTLILTDRFGFQWGTLSTAIGAGSCRITTIRRGSEMEAEIACEDLQSVDRSLPGTLAIPPVKLQCSLE
jgi:hypothetical protein